MVANVRRPTWKAAAYVPLCRRGAETGTDGRFAAVCFVRGEFAIAGLEDPRDRATAILAKLLGDCTACMGGLICHLVRVGEGDEHSFRVVV